MPARFRRDSPRRRHLKRSARRASCIFRWTAPRAASKRLRWLERRGVLLVDDNQPRLLQPIAAGYEERVASGERWPDLRSWHRRPRMEARLPRCESFEKDCCVVAQRRRAERETWNTSASHFPAEYAPTAISHAHRAGSCCLVSRRMKSDAVRRGMMSKPTLRPSARVGGSAEGPEDAMATESSYTLAQEARLAYMPISQRGGLCGSSGHIRSTSRISTVAAVRVDHGRPRPVGAGRETSGSTSARSNSESARALHAIGVKNSRSRRKSSLSLSQTTASTWCSPRRSVSHPQSRRRCRDQAGPPAGGLVARATRFTLSTS